MKKLLFIALLFSGVAYGQSPCRPTYDTSITNWERWSCDWCPSCNNVVKDSVFKTWVVKEGNRIVIHQYYKLQFYGHDFVSFHREIILTRKLTPYIKPKPIKQ